MLEMSTTFMQTSIQPFHNVPYNGSKSLLVYGGYIRFNVVFKGLFTRCQLLASQFDSSWIPNWPEATG
jgi:hypothetical protein